MGVGDDERTPGAEYPPRSEEGPVPSPAVGAAADKDCDESCGRKTGLLGRCPPNELGARGAPSLDIELDI